MNWRWMIMNTSTIGKVEITDPAMSMSHDVRLRVTNRARPSGAV
jgi:hypothetical protein